MNIKQNYKKIIGISLIINVILISLVTVFVLSQSTNTFTITSGIYPSASTYTIWVEDSIYYAKNAYGSIDYSGINASIVIQNVYDKAIIDYGGVTLFFKDGEYFIDTTLNFNTINKYFNIKGESQSAYLKWSGISDASQCMFNFMNWSSASGRPEAHFNTLTLDGGGKNITIFKWGGLPYAMWFVRFKGLSIQYFGTGTAIDTGSIHRPTALQDATFDQVRITNTDGVEETPIGVGIKLFLPSHNLWGCSFFGLDQALALYPNTAVDVVGGIFSRNNYDVYFVESSNYANSFNFKGIWFEESKKSISAIGNGDANIKNVNFYGNHFHTTNTSNLIDYRTNELNGTVSFKGNYNSPNSANKTILLGSNTLWSFEDNTNLELSVLITKQSQMGEKTPFAIDSTGVKTQAVTFSIPYPSTHFPTVYLELKDPSHTDFTAFTYITNLNQDGFTINVNVRVASVTGGAFVKVLWFSTLADTYEVD